MDTLYSNPPLKEVVCEFRFDGKWDNVIIGLFYDKMKDRYPVRESKIFITSEIKFDQSGAQTQNQFKEEISQFYSNDKSRLVQIGRNLLSINILKGYSGWLDYLSNIKLAFDCFCDIYNNVSKITKIIRIGLRYINEIEIQTDSATINLEHYFNLRPEMPEQFSFVDSFNLMVEVPFKPDKLRVNFLQLPNYNYFFDLDYGIERIIKNDEIKKHLNQAHKNIKDIFDSSLSAECKQIFE